MWLTMPTIVRFVYEILHFTYGYTYIYIIPIHHEKVILLTYSPSDESGEAPGAPDGL